MRLTHVHVSASPVMQLSASFDSHKGVNPYSRGAAFTDDSAPDPARESSSAGGAAPAAAAGVERSDASGLPTSSSTASLSATSAATAATSTAAALEQASRTTADEARSNMLHKDAFLVFRALCKLSIRTSDSAAVQDPTAVRCVGHHQVFVAIWYGGLKVRRWIFTLGHLFTLGRSVQGIAD